MIMSFLGYSVLSCFIALAAHWIVKDYHVLPSLYSLQLFTYVVLLGFLASSLYLTSTIYAYPYSIIYQCLICLFGITLLTDAYTLLISHFVTWYTIPFAWISAYYHYLPITLTESIFTTVGAYIFLKSIYLLAHKIMGKEAMGTGDIDLISCIAAWLGLYGCWFTITVGSCVGALYGIAHIINGKNKNDLQLPFGTFLCIAAIIFIVVQ